MQVDEYLSNKKSSGTLRFSSHTKEEMIYDESGVIHEREVKEAIDNSEIIEKYSGDKPYPSFLIYGRTVNNRPLHIVCAPVVDEKILIIITVYQPNPKLWENYRRRLQ